MTHAGIDEALQRETDRVEWKESSRDVQEMLQSVCALANDLGASGTPGYLLLGVDKRGQAVGEENSDDAIRRIVDRVRSVKILPNPSTDVSPAEHQGKGIVSICVEPYPVPPVVRLDGVAWVRVGPTTRRATDADLARLQERRPENRRPFDLRRVFGSLPTDVDIPLLEQHFRAARGSDKDAETFPDLQKWLGQRDVLVRSGAEWTPTTAAILVYGLDPQSHLPGAIVEFVRYSGTDLDGPVVSRKTASGRLTDQLDIVWAQILANVADTPAVPNGIRTPYVPEYPVEALKELARNMVQHRLYEGTNAPGRISWFDDRVVFNNPGRPFGQASEGEFGAHSDYRNPTITRLLVELGYVERLGRGVRRVRNLLRDNGNPPLEVETDGFTTVTVRRRT
jgi:ATP-dependent DNA helicase RecG